MAGVFFRLTLSDGSREGLKVAFPRGAWRFGEWQAKAEGEIFFVSTFEQKVFFFQKSPGKDEEKLIDVRFFLFSTMGGSSTNWIRNPVVFGLVVNKMFLLKFLRCQDAKDKC